MSAIKITEAQLAEAVVAYLEDWQWEVYQEVSQGYGRERCDIVATKGKVQWAIECKLAFGFPVIEQAYHWKRYCHYTSIAVPSTSFGSFGEQVCKQNGIGILTVDKSSLLRGKQLEGVVHEKTKPSMFRQAKGLTLVEQQKHWAKAGSQAGCGYYTPFKQTVKNMINIVTRLTEVEYTELIKQSNHHYRSDSTAKSCMRSYIGTSVIPELAIKNVDGKLVVYLKECNVITGQLLQ